MNLLTPRKPTSRWSRVNKHRVDRLVADGLTTDAGRRVIEVARANGAWTALDDVENLVVPRDPGRPSTRTRAPKVMGGGELRGVDVVANAEETPRRRPAPRGRRCRRRSSRRKTSLLVVSTNVASAVAPLTPSGQSASSSVPDGAGLT